MATPRWTCPDEWSQWSDWLAAGLHARGRRTVTSWLRAGGITTGFAGYYYFLPAMARNSEAVEDQLDPGNSPAADASRTVISSGMGIHRGSFPVDARLAD